MSEVFLPRTLDELWEILERFPGAMVYAGGTDLIPAMRISGHKAPHLICTQRLNNMKQIEQASDCLIIGAGCTHSELLKSREVKDSAPILAQALAVLGSPPIRNMGTIGGNICTASPGGDSLPALYVMRASVVLQNQTGSRSMPIQDFIRGPGQTEIRTGEILTSVNIPLCKDQTLHNFEKVGKRKAMACSIASLAAMVTTESSGIVTDIRLAWGSVGPTVITSREIEAFFIGRSIMDSTLVKQAARLATEIVSPISDLRATSDYRRQLAGRLLLRLPELCSNNDITS
jgi:xanthine dehydrogenase FAD-binding subunit